MSSRPQRTKTAKRREGATRKDAERRRLAAESRARRDDQPPLPVAWCDGGVRAGRAAAAFVLCSAAGRVLAEQARVVRADSVEEAECAAVAAALGRAVELQLEELEVRLDSQVVVGWLTGAPRPGHSRRALRPVLTQLPRIGRVSFR